MARFGAGGWAPVVVAAAGVGLLLVAASHHAVELAAVDDPTGPLSALVLDGAPALALAYGGYWLDGRDLVPGQEWRVARWCLGGGALFLATIVLSMGIRFREGRVVSEPAFTLLLAAEAGALAGFVAGYYRTRALADKRRAEQSTEGLAVVNSVIRHDLRNDLQIIEAYAELIAAGDGPPDEASGRAATVRERAARARERLDDTEAIAETIGGTASIGVVDLAAVVADVATGVEETYRVSVDADLPESAPVAANDGIRSVVDNLVENAVEHGSTSSRGGTDDAVEHSDRDDPEVAVSVEEAGDTTRLVVRDDGPGLPAEGRAVLEGRRVEGSGGGLRIVRRLVEEYGGDIAVTDNEPRGTVVTVELPAETG